MSDQEQLPLRHRILFGIVTSRPFQWYLHRGDCPDCGSPRPMLTNGDRVCVNNSCERSIR